MNFAQHAYRLASRLLAGPLLAWLWWRGRREPGYRQHLRQRLGWIEPQVEHTGGIWLHAASVGEVQAAQALITQLLTLWPAAALTVSTQTPTGAHALRAHWGERIRHVYAPLDTPGACSRFLDRLQPRCLILIEREIWPEWLRQCRERVIPVALVNARLSEASALRYQRFARLMQGTWPTLTVTAADATSARHFETLGVAPDRIHLTGNLKFDVPPPAAIADLPLTCPLRACVVAGSTHEGDEAVLLTHWPAVHAAHPQALLVLVPRHPQRFDVVARSLEQSGLRWVRQSRAQTVDAQTQVLLIDAMGELMRWYAQAHVAVIGGTFAAVGGHNPLEPLSLGRPILFGPHTFNAESLFDEIAQSGAGQSLRDGLALRQALIDALAGHDRQTASEAARRLMQTHAGASQRTLAALRPMWGDAAAPAWRPMRGRQAGRDSFWWDPTLLPEVSALDFEPAHHPGASALATGSGRGQAHRVQSGPQAMVLRHYRRGGLVAKISHDLFWHTRPENSRAMREFSLLRWMRSCQLPVPQPIAARHHARGWFYQADILIGLIPEAQNLAQRLMQRPITPAEWQALGRAIRLMHEHQVFHSDLNIHNLLLDTQGQAWIVDFDKCGLRPGHAWKAQNLARLTRSLRKESGRLQPFYWQENDFSALMTGYQSPATGPQPAPTHLSAPPA